VLFINHVLLLGVHPVNPLHLLGVEVEVEQRLVLVWYFVRDFDWFVSSPAHVEFMLAHYIFLGEHFLEEHVEFWPGYFVQGSSYSPDR